MVTQVAESLDAQFDEEIDVPESVDEAAVRRMQVVAYALDDSIEIPGTDVRVGLDPLLGLLPGAGDAVSAVFSGYIILESARLGVPYSTLVRMVANVTLDFAVGSVPVIGDVFDAVWKANRRNLELALAELPVGRHDGEPYEVDAE